MIKQLTYRFLLVCMVLVGTANGQYRSEKLKIADKLQAQKKYFEAIDAYIEVLEENPTLDRTIFKLASMLDSYGNYVEASKWYKILSENHSKKYPKIILTRALLEKKQGHYEAAIKLFEKFQKNYQGDDKSYLTKYIKNEITGCDRAILSETDSSFIQKNLDDLNSVYTDLSPVVFGGKIYYSSIPADTAITYTDEKPCTKTQKLWVADYDVNKTIATSKPKLFGNKNWYLENEHISGGAFSPDGKRFYFSRCKAISSTKNTCSIYGANKTDSIWSKAFIIMGGVNSPDGKFSSTHPTISKTKKRKRKKDQLYYASNKSGGQGGFDIWMVEIDDEFIAGKIKNMGRKINTPKNEITPFYHEQGRALYFSSEGQIGAGGYDIYKVKKSGRRFKKPRQLEKPFNTSYDDFYFHKIDKNNVLLVSNRPGAKIYHKGYILDDIFSLHREIKKNIIVNTYSKDSLAVPMDSVLLEVVQDDSIRFEIMSNNTIEVAIGSKYYIASHLKGYFNASTTVEITDQSSDLTLIPLTVERVVDEKEIRLNNLYFEFNSALLSDSSLGELDSLLTILQNNPDFVIEIGAHTDNKGRKKYNINLSQKRAQSVVDYLVSKNISQDRLVAKGYGMSKPIAPNSLEDGADNPEGRALNRRIVFKIIGTGESEEEKENRLQSENELRGIITLSVDSALEKLDSTSLNVQDSILSLNPRTTIIQDSILSVDSLRPQGLNLKTLQIQTEIKDTTYTPVTTDTIISVDTVVDTQSRNNYVSTPIDITVTKNRFRWLRTGTAQLIECKDSIFIQSVRVIAKKKTGVKFSVRIVKAKNGKIIAESEEFTVKGEKGSSQKMFSYFDAPISFSVPKGKYFIYAVVTSGQIGFLPNYTHENTFRNGGIVIGKSMYNNQSKDKTKFKFKESEATNKKLMHYGPFLNVKLKGK